MDSMSYFEIGGHVVGTSISSPQFSASSFRGAPTTETVAQVQGQRNTKVAGGRKADHTSTFDRDRAMALGEVPGRARRARMAFSIAFTLAAVDGPLPVGDALAIAFLVGYGSYEIYKSVETLADS